MVGGGCDSSYYRKLKTKWWKQLGAILLATELAASHCNYSCILCRTTSGRSRGRPRGAPVTFRLNWGPKGKKKIWGDPPLSEGLYQPLGTLWQLSGADRCEGQLTKIISSEAIPGNKESCCPEDYKKLFEKIIHLLIAEVSTFISIAQSQGKKNCYLSGIVNGLKPGVISLIGQFSRDFIGRLSVKPWCHWVWESTCDWYVSIAIYVWSVFCVASLKRTRINRDANIRTCIRRRAVEFNPDLNRVLNKIFYLGSCIW